MFSHFSELCIKIYSIINKSWCSWRFIRYIINRPESIWCASFPPPAVSVLSDTLKSANSQNKVELREWTCLAPAAMLYLYTVHWIVFRVNIHFLRLFHCQLKRRLQCVLYIHAVQRVLYIHAVQSAQRKHMIFYRVENKFN